MAEARPDEQLEQQVKEQLQNELEQQTEHRPQNAQQQTDQQLQDTLQQHIQHQQPPQSRTEVAVQHENDIEMADSISQDQATTDQGTGDSIMAQVNNAMSSQSGIPIDPTLERMQFYNPLYPGHVQTNTRSRPSFQTTTYERVQALGNTRSHASAQNNLETRDQAKMFGCGKQERRAATNETEATNERTVQAIQPGLNTVAGSGYQVLQRAAGTASNNAPAASTPSIPSFTAQASWDNPYPDPPAKDTDAFDYYAIARVEADPENLFGYPVIPVPNNSIYRPSGEAQNEWRISDPKTDTQSPAPAPSYPTFTTRNAQQHNTKQNDGGSDDVEMSGV
jgi:DNA mismatch repair ATPase MutL